jgi:hypothetical protein
MASAAAMLHAAENAGQADPAFERWFAPQVWQRDSDTPAVSL